MCVWERTGRNARHTVREQKQLQLLSFVLPTHRHRWGPWRLTYLYCDCRRHSRHHRACGGCRAPQSQRCVGLLGRVLPFTSAASVLPELYCWSESCGGFQQTPPDTYCVPGFVLAFQSAAARRSDPD